MSGKKRRRPEKNKKLKYFEKPSVNQVSTNENTASKITSDSSSQTDSLTASNNITSTHTNDQSNQEKLLQVRIVKCKPYYYVQNDSIPPRWFTLSAVRDLVKLDEIYKEHKLQVNIQILKNKVDRQKGIPSVYTAYPELTIETEHILEVAIENDGNHKYLIGYKNKNHPPEWYLTEYVPIALLENFLKLLKNDFVAEARK